MDRDAHPDRLRFDLCVVLFLTHDQGVFTRIEVRVLDAVVGIVDPFVVEAFQHVFVSRLFQGKASERPRERSEGFTNSLLIYNSEKYNR